MSITRRKMLSIGLAGGALALQGCVTTSTTDLYTNLTYTEHLDSIYISADKSKLVFIGKKYHYIFEASPSLTLALAASFRKKLTGEFDKFYVEYNEDIGGGYRLYLPHKFASKMEEKEALMMGFKKGDGESYFMDGKISGRRYAANGPVIPNATAEKLNKNYSIAIEERPSALKTVGRIAATPVTVLADGVLSIGAGIILFPVALMFMFSGSSILS